MIPKSTSYQAVCSVCYTCVLKTGSKRDCELEATSHMNAYHHNVTILYSPKPQPQPVTR